MGDEHKKPHHQEKGGGHPAIEWAEEILDEATRERMPRHHRFSHKNANHGGRSFMEGLTVYNLLWVFFSACVIGVLSETLLALLIEGRLIRRAGMLYGPFNQVYGFGAVILALLLYNFRQRNIIVIFLVSMVVEYAFSLVQERVFGSTSWDYSHMASSLHGRTNYLYGIGWGLMGYFFICHFWPWMTEMVGRIPNRIGKPLTVAIAVLLALDLALSAAAVWRKGQRHKGYEASSIVGRWLDRAYPDEVMKEKYPSMNFKDLDG